MGDKKNEVPHLFKPGSKLGLELLRILSGPKKVLFVTKESDSEAVEEKFLQILREQSQK